MRAAISGCGRVVVVLLAASLLAAGCGGAETDQAANTNPGAVAATGEVHAPTGPAGSFQIHGATYPFTVTRCDLTGATYGGMRLQGTGTGPDGRPLPISVDRTGSDMITENVFVSLGSVREGDVWSARRIGLRDGRWFMDESATEPADGRLIEPLGNALVIEATFHHEIDDRSARGAWWGSFFRKCPRPQGRWEGYLSAAGDAGPCIFSGSLLC